MNLNNMAILGTVIITIGVSSAAVIHVPLEYATIREGVNIAAQYDTVLVAKGNYVVDSIIVDKAVSIASHYLNSADENDIAKTIIQASATAGKEWFLFTKNASGSNLVGFRIEGNDQHSVGIENNSTSIMHCHFIDGHDQLSFEGSSQNLAGGYVGYCYFEGAGDDAIDCDHSTTWTIEHSTFVNAHDDAIEVRLQGNSGPQTRHILRNNIITSSGQSGIQFINYPDDSFRFFEISGNIIKDCQGSGISCMANEETNENYQGSDMEERVFIYNNTIVDCNYGITHAPNLILLNSIITACRTKGIGRSEYVSENNDFSIVDHSTFFANPVDYDETIVIGERLYFGDPFFADTMTFSLAENSPCRDSGCAVYIWQGDTVLAMPATMYSGPFPDIGAREYLTDSRITHKNLIPERPIFHQNYPNPFNAHTIIQYDIFTTAPVRIDIHNQLGQHLSTLLNGIHTPGHYEITWFALDQFGQPLPSGIYLCTIQAGHKRVYAKLVLLE